VTGSVRRLLTEVAPQDEAFRAQWANLFASDVFWPGLTHEALSGYVRKYEVEWPLRVLACLRELTETGTYDPTLARFRDARRRLKKGVVVDYLLGGFTAYPGLRQALRLAYSPKLRNLIGHNEYVMEHDAVRAIDGTFAQTGTEVWQRTQALMAVQNALVWLESTAGREPAVLAPCGVLSVGWMPLDADDVPHLVVMQLAAFRRYSPSAAWLDAAVVHVTADRAETKLGAARVRGGRLEPTLVGVLAQLRNTQRLRCEVVSVAPCLHAPGLTHRAYDFPWGRFCETDEPTAVREVPVRVIDGAARDPHES